MQSNQIQQNQPEGSSLLEDLFFGQNDKPKIKLENKAKKAENRANRELFAEEDSSHSSGSEDDEFEYVGYEDAKQNEKIYQKQKEEEKLAEDLKNMVLIDSLQE